MTRLETILSVALVMTLGGFAAFAQSGKDDAKPAPPKPAPEELFTGNSKNANLQAALDDALQKAQLARSQTVADAMFDYRVETIHGRRGGFAGFNDVAVTIRIVH